MWHIMVEWLIPLEESCDNSDQQSEVQVIALIALSFGWVVKPYIGAVCAM